MIPKLRVVIAEDENNTRAYLVELISKIDNVEVIGDAYNGQELITLVKYLEPDILFVDIQMPEIDGLKAVNTIINDGYNPYVIFLTGYEEYALDAFDLCAVDYIMKPVTASRLKKAFDKIYSFYKRKELHLLEIKDILTYQKKIFIKTGSEITFIDVDSIIMVERQINKSIIYTKNSKYTTPDTLNSLEERLSSPEFFRSHKSFIVNLKYISRIKPIGNRTYEIVFQQIPNSALISRSKANTIFSLLNIPYG